ncbi:helix-turn-helix domain-containing protein [Nonomuraea rubra]|uniref:helix-turn-helix domain-containing protein n=1 Tax=Nonomuraea rubra TaxID=46180 RepID=UPI0033F76FF1
MTATTPPPIQSEQQLERPRERAERDATPGIAAHFGQPVVMGVVTAGRLLGMGRTKAYRLARSGQFPCLVLRIGGRYVVPIHEVRALLGYRDDERRDHETKG